MLYENKGPVTVTSDSPTNVIGSTKDSDFYGFRHLCDITQLGYVSSLRMIGKSGPESLALTFNQKFGSVSLYSSQIFLEPESVFRVSTEIYCTEINSSTVKLIASVTAFVNDAIALNETTSEITFSATADWDSKFLDALAILCNLSEASEGYFVTLHHVGMI